MKLTSVVRKAREMGIRPQCDGERMKGDEFPLLRRVLSFTGCSSPPIFPQEVLDAVARNEREFRGQCVICG